MNFELKEGVHETLLSGLYAPSMLIVQLYAICIRVQYELQACQVIDHSCCQ